jgi:hypothetical protein
VPRTTKCAKDAKPTLPFTECRSSGARSGDTCLKYHGGMGYLEEYPMARYFRDSRLSSICADEIMLGIIAKPTPAANTRRG